MMPTLPVVYHVASHGYEISAAEIRDTSMIFDFRQLEICELSGAIAVPLLDRHTWSNFSDAAEAWDKIPPADEFDRPSKTTFLVVGRSPRPPSAPRRLSSKLNSPHLRFHQPLSHLLPTPASPVDREKNIIINALKTALRQRRQDVFTPARDVTTLKSARAKPVLV
jgi:hypothetical protein